MQRISVENLAAGMETYHRLCTTDGRVLLGSHVQLDDTHIRRIQNLGVYSLSIANPILERLGIVCETTLPEEKKSEAIKMLKEAFDDAKNGKTLNVYSISNMAKMIMESVRMNQIIMLDNNLIADDYVYGHCLNVATLTAVIANDMGYDRSRMQELIMGALLHDIGLVLDNGSVSEADHPAKGFEYVRKLRDYSIISGHVVFSHHEKYDGSGYPRQLKGNAIHEYARITAIADAYDRLTSDSSQGHALLPHQAYEAIMSMSDTYLDKGIADIFLAKAPLYPLGSFVILDDAQVGIVTDMCPKMQARPTIAVIADTQGHFMEEWVKVELTENLTSFISHVLSEKEVIQLTDEYHNRV